MFSLPGSSRKDRRRISKSGFATKREAEDAEARRWVEEQRRLELEKAGSGVAAKPPTTLAALLKEFFAQHVDEKLAPKTVERYHQQAAYLDPDLLQMPLGEISALHLVREWKRLSERGGRHRRTKEPRPLSPKTVRNIAGVISSAFTRGDATDLKAVRRLVEGEQADLVFTDPPYNVDYEGYTADKLTIKGDKMKPAEFDRFLRGTFASYRAVVKQGASMYVCHASSVQREFQNALEASGFEVRCQIIWAKNTFAWGHGRYKFQHEPIFYCHRAKQSDAWYGDKSQSTLWQEKKPAANRLHPTMKPIELIERALLNSSKGGDCVLDLFGGSGSTLIACERRNRKSRLMELDPKYTDVIVKRWQEYTGERAALAKDGRSFEEVGAERVQ